MDGLTPMPGPVRAARILLWIYIALMALVALGLTAIMAALTAPGPFLLIVAWSFLILAVTVVMTIKLSSRKRWVRIGLIVVMAMSCIGYLINVTSGLSLGTLLGLGLSIAVIVCLFQQDSRDYLDQ